MVTPEEVKAKTPENFWNKIKFGKPDECWEWQAYRKKYGYGGFSLLKDNGKHGSVKSHRYLFMKLFGKLPSTLQVCHSCDNPPCCNPNHLWVGTNKNNSDDMDAKGRRSKIRALGINHGNAKLTDEKVRLIRIRLKNGEEQRPIAKYFGVSQITISQISRGNIWKHVK